MKVHNKPFITEKSLVPSSSHSPSSQSRQLLIFFLLHRSPLSFVEIRINGIMYVSSLTLPLFHSA